MLQKGRTAREAKNNGIFLSRFCHFNGKKYRTAHLNEAIDVTLLINRSLHSIKKEEKSNILDLSPKVALMGKITKHFMDDLRHLTG